MPSVLHCPHARECGACQHVNEPYEAQLARKDERMRELFAEFDGVEIRSILGMEHPYYYRNKVISPYAQGKRLGDAPRGKGSRPGKGARARQRKDAPRYEILCGMYAAGTHRIIPTDECLVENEQAKRVILTIRQLMPKFSIQPYNEDTGAGFLRHAVVRVGHTSGEVLVTLVTNGAEFPASRAFCRELVKRCPFITTVVQNVNTRQTNVILGEREQRLYGPGFILDKLCGLSFRISSQSFYQVNAVQTEVLYTRALQMAGLSGREKVLDAYCGIGTISLIAADKAKEVIGVELNRDAVHDAIDNAKRNGVKNVRFYCDDAGRFMTEMAAREETVDVVLMDPPRSGSDEAFLQSVCRLKPKKVVLFFVHILDLTVEIISALFMVVSFLLLSI